MTIMPADLVTSCFEQDSWPLNFSCRSLSVAASMHMYIEGGVAWVVSGIILTSHSPALRLGRSSAAAELAKRMTGTIAGR
jgi:hypothetical protein